MAQGLPEKIETTWESNEGYEYPKGIEELTRELVERYNELIECLTNSLNT